MALGELYVMIFGEMQMLVWFAVNLDLPNTVATIIILFHYYFCGKSLTAQLLYTINGVTQTHCMDTCFFRDAE